MCRTYDFTKSILNTSIQINVYDNCDRISQLKRQMTENYLTSDRYSIIQPMTIKYCLLSKKIKHLEKMKAAQVKEFLPLLPLLGGYLI